MARPDKFEGRERTPIYVAVYSPGLMAGVRRHVFYMEVAVTVALVYGMGLHWYSGLFLVGMIAFHGFLMRQTRKDPYVVEVCRRYYSGEDRYDALPAYGARRVRSESSI